jgi:hypothetical protein
MTTATPIMCRMCASAPEPRETRMMEPGNGAAPFCARCDRRQCGHCKRPLFIGNERDCPACGHVVKQLTDP